MQVEEEESKEEQEPEHQNLGRLQDLDIMEEKSFKMEPMEKIPETPDE